MRPAIRAARPTRVVRLALLAAGLVAAIAPARAGAQVFSGRDSAARARERADAGTPVTAVGHLRLDDGPNLDPADFCPAGAEWLLRADGSVLRTSTGAAYAAQPAPMFGIRRGMPAGWMITGPQFPGGKVCADGDVSLAGVTGRPDRPLAITIVATGSVEIVGTPHLVPATSDSVLIVAGGDVRLAGHSIGGANNFEGLVYAENQCIVNGRPRVASRLVCRNAEPAPVSASLFAVRGFAPFTPRELGRVHVIPGVATPDRCPPAGVTQREYSCGPE